MIDYPIEMLLIRYFHQHKSFGQLCLLSCFHQQNPGQDTYPSSVGVMGTTVDSIKLVMTSILSTRPWTRDPEVVSMPWDEAIANSTLARANADGSANGNPPIKFGIFWSDGVAAPQPPIARGLRILYALLRRHGHKVNEDCHYFNAQNPS